MEDFLGWIGSNKELVFGSASTAAILSFFLKKWFDNKKEALVVDSKIETKGNNSPGVVGGDYIAGDKVSGHKVGGDYVAGDKYEAPKPQPPKKS